MKLTIAFKLSVLATAVAVTSTTFAATGNKDSIASDSSNWNDVVNPAHPATKDQTQYQFVDLNSTTTVKQQPLPGDGKLVTQLFVADAKIDADGKVTNLEELNKRDGVLQVGLGADAKYYQVTVESKATGANQGKDGHFEITVEPGDQGSSTKPNILSTVKPIQGGLSQYTVTQDKTTQDVRVVDGNFLQYGKKEEIKTVETTKAGNLTDDVKNGPSLTSNLKDDITKSTDPILIKDQTITVGNVYTDKKNAPGTGLHQDAVHGLQIKDLQNDEKTGKNTVNQTATLTVGQLEIKDSILGTSTSVTANGITTTGNVSAATITLAGKDLSTTIADGDAATLKSAQDFATEADKVVLKSAQDFAKAEDSKTLTAAQDFTKAEDVKTLAAAKTSADAGDTVTLAAAKDYTDVQIQQFSHTATRLNNRIDSVEEKAYSGVAIALAAQQQVPNIGAGQVAVFGGVGHYEGESAGALGLIGVLDDGRTSLSGALGIAGSGDVGGRVGVAYVFGGK